MRYHEEEMPHGICEACGSECTATVVDNGIGAYEFWGSRGVHHDYRQCSPCCEAEVVEGGEKIVRKAIHTARRDHKDGRIKRGDKYALTVYRSWRQNGPSWVHTAKRKIA